MVRRSDVITKRVQQVRGFEVVFVGSSISGLLVTTRQFSANANRSWYGTGADAKCLDTLLHGNRFNDFVSGRSWDNLVEPKPRAG
jgi:hypothetical protein